MCGKYMNMKNPFLFLSEGFFLMTITYVRNSSKKNPPRAKEDTLHLLAGLGFFETLHITA